MRLDKSSADAGIGSRKKIKQLLKRKVVAANGDVIKEVKTQVNEETDQTALMGEISTHREFFYYILHRPQDVISATEDQRDETVIDLLTDQDYRVDLFPVGRLDKDIEDLLLLTNDDQLAHQLLSLKKYVDREYLAEVKGFVTAEGCQLFA